MRVLAYDPYISEAAARKIVGGAGAAGTAACGERFYFAAHGGEPGDAEDDQCGIDRKDEEGLRIINAARGELIDEAALAEALKSGRLAGAALDVFAEEPPKNSPLVGLPNVICTPHVAGSTAEAQEEVGTQVAVQIKDYLAGRNHSNAVNLPALSADQYRRVRPYLELAERLGSLVSQAARSRPARIRIRYAGEVAEVGTYLLRSAVLAAC